MLDKHYSPAAIEAKWYRHWESTGAFKADRPDAEPYCILMPPPNVTGSLHVGHALNHTVQDVLIRFERLRGKNVLWQAGTDHAGIATQMVVERQLDQDGVDRRELGREAFVQRVWDWKTQSGGMIETQLRRLGNSCDWSRARFTMDEGLSRAVTKVFVQYYKEGLIYRDKRLVNWDPKFRTAISDLEVENREIDGHFWHFCYPLADGSGHISVATTRPETMLGDTAVAVHPDDERYKDLVGKQVRLPLTGRLIPIVADEHADPEQGSGAVKITPAHDFNDFEVGKRHNLHMINIFTAEARIVSSASDDFVFPPVSGTVLADEPIVGQSVSETIPKELHGLDRYEARKRVVDMIAAEGCLERVEPRRITMPYGDRSGVVIEPWLTDQWYVDAAKLAVEARKAVADGRTVFHPKNWEKTYFDWLDNIQPWCISRQLWWGHQIPAWYVMPAGKEFVVAETEEEAYRAARERFGDAVELSRDEDVLDTWFSSALWPFSTLGWTDETPELETFHPTSTLVTGFDIIFFWVARMMMSSLHFIGEVPFKDVYITSLVRDAQGQKMSKSKGNVIDPIDFIERYGADALRFTLAAMETQGRDIKLSEDRVEGYRNFGTKLWNAARFCQMNGIGGSAGPEAPDARLTVNRWIIGAVHDTAREVTAMLEAFRFDAAAAAIYHFVWHSFCDWYLELIKPVLQDEADAADQAETRAVAGWALDQILMLLHPFMPFLTEELWHAMAKPRATDLIRAAWPQPSQGDAEAGREIDWLIRAISAIRSARSEMNVPMAAKMPALLLGARDEALDWAQRHARVIERLARVEQLIPADEGPQKGAIRIVLDEAEIVLPLAGVIDMAAERLRLDKARAKAVKEKDGVDKRLANDGFVAKAPPEVIADARAKQTELAERVAKIDTALARLD